MVLWTSSFRKNICYKSLFCLSRRRRFFSSLVEQDAVRVRYAPSPTGSLHLGGLRTALFNYLFAKVNDGKFILRIEDTDKTREVKGSIENLIETLRTCGLNYDEGPHVGGNYGPYLQSERLAIYQTHAQNLVDNGHAYLCFCSTERLKTLRETQQRNGQPTMYDRSCLGLTKNDIETNLKAGQPYTIRMKISNGSTVLKDIIHGYVKFSHEAIDDQVLLKSDGYPTYHLANVVDDHLMKITHVIRGEEWISSTAKHLILYKAFGFQPPKFAHLGLLLNHDRSKLSKRQGDVAVEDFAAKGYLSSAIVNFVALMGWNPSRGDTQEVFTMKDLMKKFSLENVNKSGSIVDVDRLKWINSRHIRMLFEDETKKELVVNLGIASMPSIQDGCNPEYIYKTMKLMKERVSSVHDFYPLCSYFFVEPDYTTQVAQTMYHTYWNDQAAKGVHEVHAQLDSMDEPLFTAVNIMKIIKGVAKNLQIPIKSLLMPLRYCVTGMEVGAGIGETMELIGKDISLRRIQHNIVDSNK